MLFLIGFIILIAVIICCRHKVENHFTKAYFTFKETNVNCPMCGSKITTNLHMCPSCGSRLRTKNRELNPDVQRVVFYATAGIALAVSVYGFIVDQDHAMAYIAASFLCWLVTFELLTIVLRFKFPSTKVTAEKTTLR